MKNTDLKKNKWAFRKDRRIHARPRWIAYNLLFWSGLAVLIWYLHVYQDFPTLIFLLVAFPIFLWGEFIIGRIFRADYVPNLTGGEMGGKRVCDDSFLFPNAPWNIGTFWWLVSDEDH